MSWRADIPASTPLGRTRRSSLTKWTSSPRSWTAIFSRWQDPNSWRIRTWILDLFRGGRSKWLGINLAGGLPGRWDSDGKATAMTSDLSSVSARRGDLAKRKPGSFLDLLANGDEGRAFKPRMFCASCQHLSRNLSQDRPYLK